MEGSCASGFGTCCVVRLGTCGGVVTTNTTLLQNPNFPQTFSTAGTCVYLIKRASEDICQLRHPAQLRCRTVDSQGTRHPCRLTFVRLLWATLHLG